MQTWSRSFVIAGALALMAPVAAQQPPDGGAGRRPEQASEEALEALSLTCLLANLKITVAQAARLAPLLEQAQGRLKETAREEATQMAGFKATAEGARKQAVSGNIPPTATEQRYERLLQALAATRRRSRADQARTVISQLAKILNPEQQEALQKAALEEWNREPGAERRAIEMGGAEDAQSGAGSGSRLDDMEYLLRRIRSASPERWQEMRGRLQSWIRGGAGQNAPASDQRLAQLAALADQIRNMSPDDFSQAKSQLQAQMRQQVQPRQGGGGDEAEALLSFVERHLLHPVAPRVVRQRADRVPRS